jgi:CrcB protein
MTVVAFVAAAALGALLRFVIGTIERTWLGLLVVNTLGSGLLGFVVTRDLDPRVVTVVGVGFCGALTTFSSFALETRSLGWWAGSRYVALTLGGACGAAALGIALA